jgi:hypothetical protein
MWIEIPPSGQIRRGDFVDCEHTITSMPIPSGTAEKMTSLLLKLSALLGGGPPQAHDSLGAKLEQQAGASIARQHNSKSWRSVKGPALHQLQKKNGTQQNSQ